MMVLKSLLEELTINRLGTQYTVSKVKGNEKVYFGIDVENKPCLFIVADKEENIPSIRTSKIRVEFSQDYVLHISKKDRTSGKFHGIICLSKETDDINTFISVMESILLELSGNITVQAIISSFHSLVNLFSIKASPDATTSQKGLWAELFFMKNNGGFAYWAPFWHSEPTRVFDFTSNGMRNEIKCTTRQQRIHEFSHQQLVTISNDRIVIISYLLQEDDSGESLRSLIYEAKTALKGTSYYVKLERAIRCSGMANSDEHWPKFNLSFAEKNELWFRSTDIPKFPILEPSGVSGTHYQSDLTKVTELSVKEKEEWLELWKNAEP
jgi:hypothetical protein